MKGTLLVAAVATLQAQPVSYGVKVGVPINDAFDHSVFSIGSTSRWTGGPFIELHLPRRLSVEFSALARTSRHYDSRPTRLGDAPSSFLFTSTDRVTTWDFPLLVKYRFRDGAFRPFVGAGGAWSHRRSDHQVLASCLGSPGSCNPSGSDFEFSGGMLKSTLTRFGPAASAGADIKTRYVTISPEVRWNRAFSGAPVANQFSLLVGFSFGR